MHSIFVVKMDLCDFQQVPFSEIGPFQHAWMYPKNSVLQPIFDRVFFEMGEKGISSKIAEPYKASNQGVCETGNELIQVNLSFVGIVFTILCVGVGLCILVLIMEHVWSFKFTRQ